MQRQTCKVIKLLRLDINIIDVWSLDNEMMRSLDNAIMNLWGLDSAIMNFWRLDNAILNLWMPDNAIINFWRLDSYKLVET
jgi:hypothetical protein